MISLEQVRLLETKIAGAIEFVERVTAQNSALSSERANMQAKLDSYQKRIDELEVHIMRFKEDQGRIEDGIISALDRLNQFEEAFESSLKDDRVHQEKKQAVKRPLETQVKTPAAKGGSSKEHFEISEAEFSEDQIIDEDASPQELDIF